MPVNRLFQQILSAIVTVDFSINWWKLYLVSVFVFAIRTNFHLICRCVACWQFVKDFITKNNKRSVWFDLFYCLCICVIRRCISIQKMTHVVKFAFTTTLIDTFFSKVEEVINNSDMKCICNHLTSFGGGYLGPPNDVSFVKVFRELRSPNESGKFLVLAILQATLLLYLVAIVFARREDRKDRVKVSWMNYSDTWTTCWDVALCSEFYMHVFSIGFVEKLPKMFL